MTNKVKILLYCTKDKNNRLYRYYGNKYDVLKDKQHTMPQPDFFMNGKIVAESECDKVEEIVYNGWWNCYADNDSIESNYFDNDLACLSVEKLKNYLGDKNGYALHLSNVKVFDRPKELRNYCKRLPNGDFQVLGNAPQNMMNVCEIKYLIEDYVLISIQPQHLVYILNGKKTIEVRRKIISPLKNLMGD